MAPVSGTGSAPTHLPPPASEGCGKTPAPVCVIEGCGRDVDRSGLCAFHYNRKSKGRDLYAPKQAKRHPGAGLVPSADGTCGVPGCGKPIQSLGMCWAHYARERRYGLQHDEVDAVIRAQGGCGICRRAEPGRRGWVVDHDHATGRVRGVLCTRCNTGLGGLGDSIEGLTAALDYLKRNA